MQPIMDRDTNVELQHLNALEQKRIELTNWLNIVVRPAEKLDADGKARGWGVNPTDETVTNLYGVLDQIKTMEDDRAKALVKQFKLANPLAPFIKQTNGLGEKSVLRLLAVIGDPYLHPYEDRPRTLSELFSYCGLTPNSRKQKGQNLTFSPEARKRLYVIAECIIKNRNSKYRSVYDTAKQHYSAKVDNTGAPWPKQRAHLAAIRKVHRAVLIDLYLESQRLHTSA